jgi:hypothetical protein
MRDIENTPAYGMETDELVRSVTGFTGWKNMVAELKAGQKVTLKRKRITVKSTTDTHHHNDMCEVLERELRFAGFGGSIKQSTP